MTTHTAQSIARAALAAHAAGTLIPQVFQGPTWPDYVRTDHPSGTTCNCAVGAALSPSEMTLIMDHQLLATDVNGRPGYMSFGQTVLMNFIELADLEERRAISDLQNLHDRWCRSGDAERTSNEKRFLVKANSLAAS